MRRKVFTSSYKKFWSKNCALLHLMLLLKEKEMERRERGKEMGEGEREKEREEGERKTDRVRQTCPVNLR